MREMYGNYFSCEFRNLFTIFPKSDFSFTTLYIYPKLVIGLSRRKTMLKISQSSQKKFFEGSYLINEYSYAQYGITILYQSEFPAKPPIIPHVTLTQQPDQAFDLNTLYLSNKAFYKKKLCANLLEHTVMHIVVTNSSFFGTKKNLRIFVTQLQTKTLCEKFFYIKNFMSKSCS